MKKKVISKQRTNQTKNVAPESAKGKTPLINTIITLVLLLLFYPLGWIFALFLTRWPKWIKILISIVMLLHIISLYGLIRRFNEATDMNDKIDACQTQCMNNIDSSNSNTKTKLNTCESTCTQKLMKEYNSS